MHVCDPLYYQLKGKALLLTQGLLNALDHPHETVGSRAAEI